MPTPNYAELHCLTNFSFLKGASAPEELIQQALELGYQGLAITDECSLSGVVRAHRALKDARATHQGNTTTEAAERFKLIIGSEFHSSDGLHIVLLAPDRKAYGQLSSFITRLRHNSPKGHYQFSLSSLADQDLSACLALWIPPDTQFSHRFCADKARRQLGVLAQHFESRLWIAAQFFLQPDDPEKRVQLKILAQQTGIPICATGGVQMHHATRRPLRDTLTAIRLGTSVDRLGFALPSNGQQYLRSRDNLAQLFPEPWLKATLDIARQCHFCLSELRYEYPRELVPAGYDASEWLRKLTLQGMQRYWPDGVPEQVEKSVQKELELIRDLSYEHFFLTVHDIVSFARRRGILCQGRGSAANSVVCYCLGITAVDPSRMQLLFERFISRERDEPPDIDVDFEHERREEVIQYIYQKYGRHRAALAATVICYRRRSAIRDSGKALGLSAAQVERLVDCLHFDEQRSQYGGRSLVVVEDPGIDVLKVRQVIFVAEQLIGFPRHLSQHVGGFVISEGPLAELVPIENAAMADRTVIQWEKDDLETLGLLKVDVLALGMLTVIRKALHMVSHKTGRPIDLVDVPAGDRDTYDMICEADTVGVFQIESRAQMSMLPRLKPRSYYDLVVQIAIVRPGPIQGDMVHPYLRRRQGKERVVYPSKDVEFILERTQGVPIFQEQVMQIAMVAAGFTGGEADQLRRAMAAWKRKGGLEPFREKLLEGMLSRGYERQYAEQIYQQIKGFGEYGFPESHSASFALLAYVSAWLKCHHPAEFLCALLNSQPMGFYSPSQLVQDARRHGVVVLPVDAQFSDYDCTVEYDSSDVEGGRSGPDPAAPLAPRRAPIAAPPAISPVTSPMAPPTISQIAPQIAPPIVRLGLRMVSGLSAAGAQRVVEARHTSPFVSLTDLVHRAQLNRKDRDTLAAADALRSLAADRFQSFWAVRGVEACTPLLDPRSASGRADSDSVAFLLPVPDETQDIAADYNHIGLTLRRHPFALWRLHLDRYQVVPAARLGQIVSGRRVKVAGLVTCRQRPQTAAGVTFLTLEDESGCANAVVWPTLLKDYGRLVHNAAALGVVGRLQQSEGVIHIVAETLVDLSHWFESMRLSSRDFA